MKSEATPHPKASVSEAVVDNRVIAAALKRAGTWPVGAPGTGRGYLPLLRGTQDRANLLENIAQIHR